MKNGQIIQLRNNDIASVDSATDDGVILRMKDDKTLHNYSISDLIPQIMPFPMALSPSERTMVFVDGMDLWAAAANYSKYIEYPHLRSMFATRTNLRKIAWYGAKKEGTPSATALTNVEAFLKNNGYHTTLKTVPESKMGTADMTSELICDALPMGILKSVDHVVLVSGNGRYLPMIKALQTHGVFVTVMATQISLAQAVSRLADQVVSMEDVLPYFTRNYDASHRNHADAHVIIEE